MIHWTAIGICFSILSIMQMQASGEKEIANQTSQDLSKMPSIARGEAGVYEVPLVIASEETLQGFGHIVHDFDAEEVIIVTWPAPGWRPVVPGTGNEGGIVNDSFTMQRTGNILYAENNAVGRRYITGWLDDPAMPSENILPERTDVIYTHEANYHPDGGQVFFPADGQPFIALLAKPGDDISPKDFVAFYFDGTFGVQINPNVWHQPMFPIGERARFKNKQGAVHACIGVDFIQEFGVYFAIPVDKAKT